MMFIPEWSTTQHYTKVNKKRKSARADIVEIDDKEPESKDEDDLVADPRGWTQLKSKNLTLEEILDLESDKEVHFLVYLHCLLCPCPLFIMHFSFGMCFNHLSMSGRAQFQSTM